MAVNIVRVFPRRTSLTPDDALAFVGDPPLWRPEADEVHVSCTFTWDIPEAKRLAEAWSHLYQPADQWIEYSREWRQLARTWQRPAAMYALHAGGAR
jgi:hypothetical protein